MGAEENKAAVRGAIEALNAGDLDRYLEIYAPNCVAHGFGPGPIGPDGLRQFYATIWSAFPDGRVTFDEQIGEGDRVSIRYTFRGTHRGELMGLPPTGKAVAMGGQTILRFREGKIVERWQNADFFGLMQQLGAVPTPA